MLREIVVDWFIIDVHLAEGDGMQPATAGGIPYLNPTCSDVAGNLWLACEIIGLQYEVKQR